MSLPITRRAAIIGLLFGSLHSDHHRGTKLMKILIETIPHKDQRYATAGDWQFKQGAIDQNTVVVNNAAYAAQADGSQLLHIRVSELGDWRYEALVAVHELVEALLCKYGGITEQEVDKFDMDFEARRPKPRNGNTFSMMELQMLSPRELEKLREAITAEPGDDPRAPYHSEHVVATSIETRLAGEMEVDWGAYSRAIERL